MNTAVLPSEESADSLPMRWLARGLLPDAGVRFGIRRLLRQRLREEDRGDAQAQQSHLMQLIAQLRASPIALHTTEANSQHYELPPEFFVHVLGPRLKYSCGYYEKPSGTLAKAEECMLALTAKRARLADGERILELGCGWGSLSLWMAERYPRSNIVAVSNSRTQKSFIDARAAARNLKNLEIITCDMNVLDLSRHPRFDRVVSVEMFEHMRNYQELMRRISTWMNPGASLFVHIFTHRQFAYPFEIRDESDWLAKYFFTGGIMPSDDLLLYFQRDLQLSEHWQVDGTHYQRTSEHWLRNFDRARREIDPILAATYGEAHVTQWRAYWRVFFMSCAQMWGFARGREWMVSHYLFEKPAV